MSNAIEWQLLVEFLAGECSPADRERVARWVREDPEAAATIRQLDTLWRGAEAPAQDADAFNATVALYAVHGRIADTGVSTQNRTPARVWTISETQKKQTRWQWRPMAIAAALVLAVVGSFYWLGNAKSKVSPPVTLREFATAKGQRATIHLSDGTQVTLNVDSRLRVPSSFGVNTREIYLDGSAYFSVVHDVKHPFRVHARGSVMEDVGTRFAVRAYTTDTRVAVAVSEGSVAIQVPHTEQRTASSEVASPLIDRNILLTAGELGVVSDDGKVETKRLATLDAYLGWVDGRLVFDEVPLRTAIPQLERWYNIDIHLADSALANRRIRASFAGDSAQKALIALALMLDARYEQQGRVVTFDISPRSPRLR